MDILICYDVETVTSKGRKRLRQVAILCQNHGQRVQKSVFECRVTRAQFEALEASLEDLIDPETDSVRIYTLPPDRRRALRVLGPDSYQDFEDALIY